MNNYELKAVCPFCAKTFTSAAEISTTTGEPEPRAPEHGDVTMCIGCGQFSVFKRDKKNKKQLVLMVPNQREALEIQHDENCYRMWRAWKMAPPLTPNVEGMTAQ